MSFSGATPSGGGGGGGGVEDLGDLDVTATATELNVLDGIPATLTATELGYVDGVTSAIQTQLDAKQPLDTELTRLAANTVITGHVGLVPTLQRVRIDAPRNLVDDASSQAVFPSTEDELTVVAGMTYRFQAKYLLTKGTNSVNPRVLFGGTATFTTIAYTSLAIIVAAGAVGTAITGRFVVATAVTVVASAAAAAANIILDGEFEVNAGGTLIPQVSWSGATGATPTVIVGSYFECWPTGANPDTFTGPWS
jgi:hypothetical protein